MKNVRRFALAGALLAFASTGVQAQLAYAQRYAASTDLRPFVDQRASSPKDGSYFYAYWARWECLDDASAARRVAARAQPARSPSQAEAVRSELERCRNLPASLSTGAWQRKDVQDGRAAGDRLFARFKGKNGSWFSVDTSSELQHALGLLAPGTDPNMIWVLAQQFARMGAAGRLAVHGQPVPKEEGPSVHAAFHLAACSLGVDCGRSHRWMRSWCVQDGDCDDVSIEAYWRRLDSQRQEKMNWPAITRYRELIVSAAKSGDWSAFALIPHTGQ